MINFSVARESERSESNTLQRNLLGMKGRGTPVEISQRIVSLKVGSGVVI